MVSPSLETDKSPVSCEADAMSVMAITCGCDELVLVRFVDTSKLPSTLALMEVHLTTEQQRQLGELASHRGRDAVHLRRKLSAAISPRKLALSKPSSLATQPWIAAIISRTSRWGSGSTGFPGPDPDRSPLVNSRRGRPGTNIQQIEKDNPAAARETIKATQDWL
jgi:hypothetical protein